MIATLHQLYIHHIKDLHSAERQSLAALKLMHTKASCEKLTKSFEDHVSETKQQLARLDTILRLHDEQPAGVECEAAKGIVKEGQSLISELRGQAVDAGLIAAAQRFEHYEIAAYGTAKAYADALDLDDDAELLAKSLEEESAVNDQLTKIAVGGFFTAGVNKEASAQ